MKKHSILVMVAMLVAAMGSQTDICAQNHSQQKVLGTVKTASGKTIYLIEQQDSESIPYVTAYTQSNGQYKEEKAFKVSKAYQSVIKSVDAHLWVNSNPNESFFAFNKADNSLYIPLINITTTYYGGAEHELVTSADRYLVYQFDGEHFVYKRKDAGFWLHKDLRSFESLVYVGKSKDYLIRIDSTKEGFRYAAWKGQNEMTSKPNLVLIGKIRLTHGVQLDLGFGFENKGYTYEVWTKDYPEGPQLVVRQGDKVLLQQGLREIVSNPNY